MCSPVVYPGVRQSASAPGGRGVMRCRSASSAQAVPCHARTSAVSVGAPPHRAGGRIVGVRMRSLRDRIPAPLPIPPLPGWEADGRGMRGTTAQRLALTNAPLSRMILSGAARQQERLCRSVGAWRSLVAHSVWDAGVVGSNPSAPTILIARRLPPRSLDPRARSMVRRGSNIRLHVPIVVLDERLGEQLGAHRVVIRQAPGLDQQPVGGYGGATPLPTVAAALWQVKK